MIRKINSVQDIEKKKRRNNFLLGGFLVLLMILSTLGYAIIENQTTQMTETAKYGSLKFERTGQYWVTNVGGQLAYFNYLPEEVKNVPIEGSFDLTAYLSETVYFVNASSSSNQIYSALQTIAVRIQDACLDGEICVSDNLPVKNCTDNLFVYTSGSDKIYTRENCIYLSGDAYKTTDRLLYKFYGIL